MIRDNPRTINIMKWGNKVILKSIILFLLISSVTVADDVTDIIKEIQEKYEDIEYLSADFVQVEKYKLTGSQNETRGKIFIKGV